MISVFDLFSIGIGPSSSHTVGPMNAANDFTQRLKQQLTDINRLTMTLYGSLAFTGRGHRTDYALLMGLEGELPETINPDEIPQRIHDIYFNNELALLNDCKITFDPSKDLIYNYKDKFDYHPNAIKFTAYDKNDNPIDEAVYFSLGGGFIIREDEIENQTQIKTPPFPFQSAAELLRLCEQNNMTIRDLMLENEKTWDSEKNILKKLMHIANIMESCIEKGCQNTGVLPGGLQVGRRAPALYNKLMGDGPPSASHPHPMNWLNTFAMAVNEENAAGGRIVTAPTNGAAGTVPAVINFYRYFCKNPTDDGVITFLLTAGAIGMLYKFNASISGAEMGCQGEVGVACSMAAGGLVAALGGTLMQIENAAEIGMEHNLGLTCDPVNGLVQIPCIERNAMAAVKAVNSAQLALAETGSNKISLDMVISTMREIGNNMNTIYKETSLGGLAVAVNVSEC